VKLSVVIPAWNEAESLPELVALIDEHAAAFEPYEILVIDDGSRDGSRQLLEQLCEKNPHLGFVSFGRNYGKSAALATAFARLRGDYVITMDADLQDDPAEIPRLIAEIEKGYDLVSGWKRDRKDPLSKTLPSKLFNGVMRRVTGLRIHDFNCGLKAYRREVIESIRLYGELHRFIPALTHWEGFRVAEIPVRHHERRYGQSKFGARRFLNGLFDLMTVVFVARRSATPLHSFGRIGFWFFALGMIINGYFGLVWLITQELHVRPLLILGMVLVLMAVQIWSLGLLGELMIHLRAEQERYRIAREREPRGD